MFENIWNAIKGWCTTHSQHAWVEHHLMYFSIIFGMLFVLVMGFLINRKVQKDIDKMNNDSRKTNVSFMRETSERAKKEKEEKKKLRFEDE
jgi:hypothetical protein